MFLFLVYVRVLALLEAGWGLKESTLLLYVLCSLCFGFQCIMLADSHCDESIILQRYEISLDWQKFFRPPWHRDALSAKRKMSAGKIFLLYCCY